MKKFFWSVVRFVLALLFLFLTVGAGWVVAALPMRLNAATIIWPFAAAFVAGALFFVFIARMQVLYVFGHELTHLFTAKLFFRETGEVNVGSSGGSVSIQKPNIWITLAPYFVPFYTLCWIACYAAFRLAYGPPTDTVSRLLFAGIGLTYAYHVVMTAHSLVREQSDLRSNGYFLSLALVIFFNVLFLAVCLISLGGHWGKGVELFQDKLGLELSGVTAAGEWLYDAAQTAVNWVKDTLF